MLTHVIYDLIALRDWTFRHQTELRPDAATRVGQFDAKIAYSPQTAVLAQLSRLATLAYRQPTVPPDSIAVQIVPKSNIGSNNNNNWCNSSAGSDVSEHVSKCRSG